MVLEDRRDIRSYREWTVGWIHEIPDEADVIGVGQLHEHNDVGNRVDQRRINGMPDPFPRIDGASTRTVTGIGDLRPRRIVRPTDVADVLRTPLVRGTGQAVLQDDLLGPQPAPERFVQSVAAARSAGHAPAGGRVGVRRSH